MTKFLSLVSSYQTKYVLLLISSNATSSPLICLLQGVNKAWKHKQHLTLLQIEDVFDNIIHVHLFG